MTISKERRVRLGLEEEGKRPKDFIETLTGFDRELDKISDETRTQADLVADIYYKLPKNLAASIVSEYIEYFWASNKDEKYDMLDNGFGYEVLMSSYEPVEMIVQFIVDRVDDNPLS
jgi:hypothetical protein